jgi:hypothetical protein
MSNLLSGSKLRVGGNNEFLNIPNAQPQLPETTSTTGFTLITNNLLQTRYASSLGNIEFNQSTMYSNQSVGTITVLATGTVSLSTSTATGTLVITGGVGIGRNLYVKDDINVNGLTIGQGVQGKNNMVFTGTAVTAGPVGNPGESNFSIGYNNLRSIDTGYKNISIGNNATSTGTNISETIAIGHNALRNLAVVHSVSLTPNSITSATQTNPVVITVTGHNLNSGTHIIIKNVQGMTQLNNTGYYVNVINANRLALYTDSVLAIPVNGTAYTTYTTAGIIERIVSSNDNVAIGNDSAPKLLDGEQNFFIGNRTARDLTTGSYNFFIGTEIGNNVKTGNGIISIGSELIQDGVDDQVGIGSTFYYDGRGLSRIYSSTQIGLGAASTSTTTGALTVIGGVGVRGSVYSQEGNDQENYLLYSPRVFVEGSNGGVSPLNPRIGDTWFDTDTFGYFAYVSQAGGNPFWLQVSSI